MTLYLSLAIGIIGVCACFVNEFAAWDIRVRVFDTSDAHRCESRSGLIFPTSTVSPKVPESPWIYCLLKDICVGYNGLLKRCQSSGRRGVYIRIVTFALPRQRVERPIGHRALGRNDASNAL